MTKNILNDNELRILLKKITSIVMIGVSASPLRASFFVARYFVLRGISVIPINPNYEGKYLWGEKVLGKISDIGPDKRVDIIDIFRPSKEVPYIVEDTIKYLKPLGCKTVWMQIGIENKKAAKIARNNGMNVIMDKCPKIENQRLFGELRVAGFNTSIISSKIDF
tara:strand:+ start:659 stop:1153 length:495 start_codon:yes stop_codon:yes gene_type:complete